MKTTLIVCALIGLALMGCDGGKKKTVTELQHEVDTLSMELDQAKRDAKKEKIRGDQYLNQSTSLEGKIMELRRAMAEQRKEHEETIKIREDIARSQGERAERERAIQREMMIDTVMDRGKKEKPEKWDGTGLPPGVGKK